MNCPDCEDRPLIPHAESEIEIDQCHTCEGIWFDLGELETYRARHSGAEERTGRETFVPGQAFAQCPRCLRASLQLGVVGDRRAGGCTQCRGIWISQSSITPCPWPAALAHGLLEALSSAVLHGLGG